jgi:predicted AlkP superfamily pyrophosphatase or phosphodiesterase
MGLGKSLIRTISAVSYGPPTSDGSITSACRFELQAHERKAQETMKVLNTSMAKRGLTLVTLVALAAGSGVWLATTTAAAGQSAEGASVSPQSNDQDRHGSGRRAARVLLLSIDGFHQFDLTKYMATHPESNLGGLVNRGTQYVNTTSSRPSDSFPGTLAMTTGGSPASTGIYYDVVWDDRLSPPSDTTCLTRGAIAAFDGQANVDDTIVDAVLDPTKLPRDPERGCAPVYPHSFLRVNTIFEVIKAHGGRTAVTDKHPSYELLNGPSGTGIDDFWGPENDANGAKKSIAKMEAYDETKVQAVINQIDGYDHTRTNQVGVPAIIMMNFQSANIGEKVGGYADAAGTPTAALSGAFDYVDDAIGRILAELQTKGLTGSTLVIVTAKHGDSPVDLASRRAIDPALVDATVNGVQAGLVALNTPDTVELLWLKDHSKTAAAAAALQANTVALGIETIYSGNQIRQIFDGTLDYGRNRRPDIIIQPVPGVIYTTSGVSAKKVEHGGFSEENTHVPLILAGPGAGVGTVTRAVDLRQVAPTILKSLGLNPKELQAVRQEHTKRLPIADVDQGDGDD